MWKPSKSSGRKPIPSYYSSLDGNKETVYLSFDRGKPIAQHHPRRERSPSPDFSDIDNHSSSSDAKPAMPIKNLKARMQFGKRKKSISGMPPGLAPKAPEWEQRRSQEQGQTNSARDSPGLPDPDMGTNIRDDMPIPSESRFSWTTYGGDDPPRPLSEADALPDLSSLTFSPQAYHGQPASRFSWSTHNTNKRESMDTTSVYSPRPGAVSSPPSPPLTPPASVLARRRPLPRPDEYGFYPDKPSPAGIKRKPTPSEAASLVTQLPIAESEDQAKDLPQFPPRNESRDKVITMQVELDTLENRKYNLQKVITGLTALVPSNPVEFDLRKRREHKERLDAFERELADVKRKEHEVGLKLHKLIRKREGDEQPTGLWVRRVTG